MQALLGGKENKRGTISRRAKNDSKKLTVSPLKERERNVMAADAATTDAPVKEIGALIIEASTKVEAPAPRNLDTEKIAQLEEEKEALQKISDDLSISYATVLKMKDNLDMEKRELQVNNARLAAEVSVVQLQKEQAEKALRDQIAQIQAQKLAMAADHKKAQEEFERILEAEKKKFDILQKEHLTATKNLESKIAKLEKNKDLLQINKEMIANLQSEKKALLEQLDAERETTRRLHSYVESTTEDAARFEEQLEAQTQLVEKLQRDIDHKNRNLFFTTGLSMKLHKLYYDEVSVNVSIQELWESAQSQDVKPENWNQFLEDAFAAVAPAKMISANRTNQAPPRRPASSTPSKKGNINTQREDVRRR